MCIRTSRVHMVTDSIVTTMILIIENKRNTKVHNFVKELWGYNFVRANGCECNGSSEIPFVAKIELNNEKMTLQIRTRIRIRIRRSK